MKAKFFFLALIAIACIACEPSHQHQPDYLVEKVTLSVEDKATLDGIFAEYNNVIRGYAIPRIGHDTCEKCHNGSHKSVKEVRDEHRIVEVIGSQEELLALCPEGVQPLELDFNECCIVWAGLQTASSGNSFTAADLYDLGNGNYCFHCTIQNSSINCAIGYVFPYAVCSITKDQIKNLQKNIVSNY